MISVVINVRNGQEVVERCLKSVSWADEIVVIDDESTDDTVKIAKKYTDKIYEHKSAGFVEPARNFAISKASYEWILVLDADEEIPATLAGQLKQVAGNQKDKAIDYVSIPRKNIIFNKWIQHSGWWPDYNVRFFRKGKVSWSDKIHADAQVEGKELELEPKEELAIIHQNYQTISQYLNRMNKYTDIESNQRIKDGEKFSLTKILRDTSSEFFRRYFAWEGYKDGLHGLVLSILQSVSAFVVGLKIWEAGKFSEATETEVIKQVKAETKQSLVEFKYWYSKTKLASFWSRLKGKIL